MINYDSFQEHILNCFPMEGCGIILENIFIPFENISIDPINYFEFSEKDSKYLLSLSEEYQIIHSHTQESFTYDPRTPSKEDMIGQENTQVEWGIVHCDGKAVSDILWFGSPKTDDLIGRKYIHNVYDCFTLVRDFYFKEFIIDVGSHPRPPEWEEWNPHYINNTYKNLGFIDIKKEDIKYGDVVLFAIASRTSNHVGIYLGDDKFIHHLYQRTSSIDTFSKWNRQLIKVIRLNNGT